MPDGAYSLTQTVQAGCCVQEPTFVGFYPPEFAPFQYMLDYMRPPFSAFLFQATDETCSILKKRHLRNLFGNKCPGQPASARIRKRVELSQRHLNVASGGREREAFSSVRPHGELHTIISSTALSSFAVRHSPSPPHSSGFSISFGVLSDLLRWSRFHAALRLPSHLLEAIKVSSMPIISINPKFIC